DERLKVWAIGSSKYALETPRPGWAEQQPGEILRALDRAVRECVAGAPAGARILGIAFDSAMHSLIGVGANDAPLTAVWTWADMRAAGKAKELAAHPDAAELYRRTGCPVHAMYFPAKVAWLKESDP